VAEDNPLWGEYLAWMNTPVEERVPSTEAEWAAAHDVSDRTVRRWRTNPRFLEFAERGPTADVRPAADVVVGGDAANYQQVKSQLVEAAMKGNPKALELYFRTYGKEFVAEEAAARTLDLANVDLEDLVFKTVTALGEDVVAEKLRGLGWKVERV